MRRAIELDHADPNERDADGVPAIAIGLLKRSVYWHKADERAVEVARYLFSHGADPNARFRYGGHQDITALHIAAYDGDVRLVRLLVDAGAEVNTARDDGATPLHAAARCDFRLSCDDCGTSGARPTLELLVAHGGDLRKKTSAGRDVLSTVPTPCAEHPELCEPERLESASWYSGTCKQTYVWITRMLVARPAR